MKAPKPNEQITAGNYMLENLDGQFILHYTGGNWLSIEVTEKQIIQNSSFPDLWEAAQTK